MKINLALSLVLFGCTSEPHTGSVDNPATTTATTDTMTMDGPPCWSDFTPEERKVLDDLITKLDAPRYAVREDAQQKLGALCSDCVSEYFRYRIDETKVTEEQSARLKVLVKICTGCGYEDMVAKATPMECYYNFPPLDPKQVWFKDASFSCKVSPTTGACEIYASVASTCSGAGTLITPYDFMRFHLQCPDGKIVSYLNVTEAATAGCSATVTLPTPYKGGGSSATYDAGTAEAKACGDIEATDAAEGFVACPGPVTDAVKKAILDNFTPQTCKQSINNGTEAKFCIKPDAYEKYCSFGK